MLTITNMVNMYAAETKRPCEKYFTKKDCNSDGLIHWELLPKQILIKIFDYLQQNDFIRVATVCQSWRYVVNHTPKFWRKIHLRLSCKHKPMYRRKACWLAKTMGRYFQEVYVSCNHKHDGINCKNVRYEFCELLSCLPNKLNLTKLKITDLLLESPLCFVIRIIRVLITRLLSKQDRLECFQMSSANWPVHEGNNVLYVLFSVARGTLQSLLIDGFYEEISFDYGPEVFDNLFSGILSLSRLTKLGIDYVFLSDFFLAELSRTFAGQLKVLKVTTSQVDRKTSILSRSSWVTLTKACPALKVAFTINGMCSLFKTIRKLSPVVPVYKLRLSLRSGPNSPDVGSFSIAALLGHVTMSYRHTLVKFELDFGRKSGFIDLAFLMLVKKCQHLVYVETPKQFSHPESERVVRNLIQQRRRKLNMRLPGYVVNKRVKINPVNQAGPSSTKQDQAGPSRTKQGQAGPSRDKQDQAGPSRTEHSSRPNTIGTV
ncbi:F-box only protein 39-like [Physella acuta]|uniref:F-box only protein 39-like n=1 Tax=Physella acuta TaxID=109671 RepID=UPI0027DE4744|nr:F-box only protein 39-like [Physella acuta]